VLFASTAGNLAETTKAFFEMASLPLPAFLPVRVWSRRSRRASVRWPILRLAKWAVSLAAVGQATAQGTSRTPDFAGSASLPSVPTRSNRP